ncbi:MAG TPA: hypothetical protein VN181_00905 [Thermoanaerobaculia bacterium]|nr:hypothetical protein [Thermoanaerobaculia bacterium]
MNMKKLMVFAILLLVVAAPSFAQSARRQTAQEFASDFQTVPVMGNTFGANGSTFLTFVAVLNPTSSAFPIEVSLYDTMGTKHDATITLAARELKTYNNFLAEVFNFNGGGAVTFKSAESTGGTHNNRFIISAQVQTGGTRYNTPVPALEFPGTSSPSFAAGVTVDTNTRTNVGCFNQSAVANTVKVTVLDKTGTQTVGTTQLSLPANAWGQTGIASVVSNGYVRFEPSEAAVCYASVVENATNDARLAMGVEYTP